MKNINVGFVSVMSSVARFNQCIEILNEYKKIEDIQLFKSRAQKKLSGIINARMF